MTRIVGSIDVTRLALALEASRPDVEKAESVGWRYGAIHDDALCARDEWGCGCLCHAAKAVAAIYTALAASDEAAA